jgi:hypothetical protein
MDAERQPTVCNAANSTLCILWQKVGIGLKMAGKFAIIKKTIRGRCGDQPSMRRRSMAHLLFRICGGNNNSIAKVSNRMRLIWHL